jgi:hypothetical protein
MEQQTEQTMKVSDVLKQTSVNISELMLQIAIHIDKIEEENVQLKNRIAELENK